MSRACELTGLGILTGNKVSHSNRKTRRKFLPNLQPITLSSEALKRTIKFRIATKTLRTVDFKGGLDNFLIDARAAKLAPGARVLRAKIKAILEKDGKAPMDQEKKVRKSADQPKKKLTKKLQVREGKAAVKAPRVKSEAKTSSKKIMAKKAK